MTTVEQSAFAGRGTRLYSFTRAVAAVSRFVRILQNRRAVHLLGEMSDAQLADIGLRRGDLLVAFATPLDVDPTEMLGAAASERSRSAL